MRRSALVWFACGALLLAACNDVLGIHPPSEATWSRDGGSELEQSANADQGEDAGQ